MDGFTHTKQLLNLLCIVYMIFYIGWDQMEFLSVFIQSPSVTYRYINKLCLIPISGVKFVH